MDRLAKAVSKLINSEAVIDTCLIASFTALAVRSLKQQKDIEALESEKESLIKANKTLRKLMWDWKQELFAEAATDSTSVPLATLKAIYGEAPTPPPGEAVKEDAKSPDTKLVI